MAKRGTKPKGNVEIKWSANFAYVIGLIVTDGNLSPSGRHINFTSKDLEQVKNLKRILKLKNKIGIKSNGITKEKKYHVIQFGDVLFYEFLQGIGITAAKSKTVGEVMVPNRFFFHFLRGCFDGDGCSYSYWDPRWRSSFLFYISFVSASERHINWLRKKIGESLGVYGHVGKSKKISYYQLKYAKNEAIKIVKKMYTGRNIVFLKRKKLKLDESLAIMGKPRKVVRLTK